MFDKTSYFYIIVEIKFIVKVAAYGFAFSGKHNHISEEWCII